MRVSTLTPLCLLLAQGLLAQGLLAGPQKEKVGSIQLRKSTRVELDNQAGYRIHREDRSSEWCTPRNVLHLRKEKGDPLATSRLAEHSTLRNRRQTEAHRGQAFLVQFHTALLPEYLEDLKELGVECHTPVPDQALVVLMPARLKQAVSALSFVRWVGPYLPTHKLEEGLDEVVEAGSTEKHRYNVMFLDRKLSRRAAARMRSLGIPAEESDSKGSLRLQVELDGAQLGQVSELDEILFIDRVTEAGDDLDVVRPSSGVNELETVAGYAGQGVRGEICEIAGMLATHEAFRNFPAGNILANQADASHGTPVTSCTFGAGNAAGQFKGILTQATPYYISLNSLNNGAYPTAAQRRAHIQKMIDPNGPYRIVFQTYSNGHATTTAYTTDSADNDQTLFDLDILTFQSQSNTGNTQSRPEAWSKNVVSVGGMAGKGTVDMADDGKSNASTGYASDGRIKPDLAHYYTVKCAGSASNTTWANINGTSFSTPSTAGLGGLFMQMWADGVFDGGPGKGRDVFGSRPHAATAKAVLINTAKQWSFTTTDAASRGRNLQGWGMVDVKGMYDSAKASGWAFPILINESAPLLPQATHTYPLNCDGTKPLKATLVYKDPAGNPAASKARVNDLTLKVTSPSGLVYWGNNGLKESNWSVSGGAPNDIDTVENVFIKAPEAGSWKVEVLGSEIVQDTHKATTAVDAVYALVVQGGSSTSTPTDPFRISTQPAHCTVVAGQSASFTVAASGGSTPYAYQWTRNGQSITGATSATYTFTAQAEDNGATFAATLTDAAGAKLTSSNAILTVKAPEEPGTTTINETEPNNSRAAGQVLSVRDLIVKGALGTTTDKDYFRVNLPAGATLNATLALPSTANFDFFLYDSGGMGLASSKNATGVAEKLSYRNSGTTTKDVYLSIKPVSGTPAGAWTMTVKW